MWPSMITNKPHNISALSFLSTKRGELEIGGMLSRVCAQFERGNPIFVKNLKLKQLIKNK